MYCIYLLKDQEEIPFYVGKSSIRRIFNRKAEHIYESGKSTTKKSNKIRKILRENNDFYIKIIDYSTDEDEIFEKEKFYIKKYKKKYNLCNLTDGGEGLRNPSLETRKKISQKAKGRISGNKNPSCKDSVKKKRSLFLKKSNPMHNCEIKEKAIAKIRKKCAKEVIKYDKDNNMLEKYVSIREAALKNQIGKEGISRCCNKKLKTSGGFIWKFGGNI